jgi:endonuclease-3
VKGTTSSNATARNNSTTTPNQTTKSPKKKKATTPKKKKTQPSISRSSSPPDGWQDMYSLVEELRQDRSAPVDSDGAEVLADPSAEPKTYRFQVLVALLLSSQTKDAVVGDTTRALQNHGLTVDNIATTSPEDLNALIERVGFHNNKTKYLKQVVEILQEKYDGDIPPSADEMMDLPGIGPKMAYIIENICWNRISGIGIDTHMHRMFKQLNWVTSATKTPEQTRVQLESWLPKEYWSSVNLLWVGMGQEVQQSKAKVLRKALDCSRPKEALKLVKRLGLDYNKEGKKQGWMEEIQKTLQCES